MITVERRIELLSRVPLFSGLSKRALRRLASLGRETYHNPGKAIVREGRTGHAFHLIVDGKASVQIKERVVSHLGPGDFFGEIALLDKGPRTATVTADAPVTILAIEGTALRDLIESDGSLALQMLAHLAGKVRELDKRLVD